MIRAGQVRMMNVKRLGLALYVIALLFFSSPGFAAEFKADMTMETSGETITSKVFVSGSLMRQETEIPGGGTNISIIDGTRGLMFVLIPGEKMYMEFPNNQMILGDEDIEKKLSDDADLKKIGTETVEGYQCDKYEVIYKNSEMWAMESSVVWVARKLNFPIKGISQGKNGQVVMTCKNISEEIIDQSLFEVPKDYSKFSY